MTLTTSKLRDDIYNILDGILETGAPVEIERKGRVLRIMAEAPPASRVARMKKRPGMINGNPEDLETTDWSANWTPEGNF